MSAAEWLHENGIDLRNRHGNIGDLEGNLCIEQIDGSWIFWSRYGIEDVPEKFWR